MTGESHHMNSALAGKIQEETGIEVNHCYQCGKCSAGCPVVSEMDITSSAVMRLLQYAEDETDQELLQSESIWLCLSCEMCISRCPMQIDIPKVMDFLRQESIRKNAGNKKSRNIVRFHRAFMDMVKTTGRSYEIGLMVDYKLRSGTLLQDMALAPKMLAKGKLPILPEQIKNKKEVKRLFKNIKDKE